MKKIIFSLITSLIIILGLPIFTQASPLAYPTERIAGQDRIETSLKISQKGWQSAQTVVLCEYSDYADSIASTPFAVSVNAPLLLTSGDSLDSRVVQELQRLNPQKVILLGGKACLKPSIEEELTQLSFNYERIGGSDRYQTSILLAKRLNSNSLILANGDNFPDALSAASYAGIKQIPIVLTSNSLPGSVITYYKEANPDHLIVIGGEAVVPSEDLTQNNLKIETRLGGQDRYETNAKVVSFMKTAYDSNDLFLASGQTFPDAIAGTVLASKYKAPLLLTEKNDIPPSIYSLLRNHMKVEQVQTGSSDGADSVKTGQITANGGLNLRENPTTGSKILLAIPEGTTVTINGEQSQWYQTTYQSATGWISANYVKIGALSQNTTDISVNGSVLLLGGQGVISTNTENILEGKSSSSYSDNLKDFPSLPNAINTDPPSRGDSTTTTPGNTTTPIQTDDPSKEVPIDPFNGYPANALAGKTILVDPGHGGPDTGAIGPNKTTEKNNTLAISLALRDILKQAGATVILTRDKDISPAPDYSEIADLQARVDIAKNSNVDLFICIHNDSFTNPDVQGTSTYYSADNPKSNESLHLANSIETAVLDTIKSNNRGVKEAGFYVLRNTSMPAILLETEFISNPYAEARLQDPIFQKNVAAAIFHGIYNYYKNPLPQP
ncbi:N-acetylmuramoyl-L-alanine amidase [Desulfitobacterium sp. AusDCA]|uniref:N-acetylmuramoyl-L-alanine amidase n=1 Tax=Desulfitobacterium sp. AusDCA TaxID=3240383 RepID=UPI003DA77210